MKKKGKKTEKPEKTPRDLESARQRVVAQVGYEKTWRQALLASWSMGVKEFARTFREYERTPQFSRWLDRAAEWFGTTCPVCGDDAVLEVRLIQRLHAGNEKLEHFRALCPACASEPGAWDWVVEPVTEAGQRRWQFDGAWRREQEWRQWREAAIAAELDGRLWPLPPQRKAVEAAKAPDPTQPPSRPRQTAVRVVERPLTPRPKVVRRSVGAVWTTGATK